MKKILIVSHAMEIGGAERALAGLLSAFDPEKYSVDLFLFRHEGGADGSYPRGNKPPTGKAGVFVDGGSDRQGAEKAVLPCRLRQMARQACGGKIFKRARDKRRRGRP